MKDKILLAGNGQEDFSSTGEIFFKGCMKVIKGGLDKLQKETFDSLMKEDGEAFAENFAKLSKLSRQRATLSSVPNKRAGDHESPAQLKQQ